MLTLPLDLGFARPFFLVQRVSVLGLRAGRASAGPTGHWEWGKLAEPGVGAGNGSFWGFKKARNKQLPGEGATRDFHFFFKLRL